MHIFVAEFNFKKVGYMKKIIGLLLCSIVFSFAVENKLTGKELYQKCMGCHGEKGQTKAMGKSMPIGGQDANTLIEKLKGYADGTRNVNGMGMLMKGQIRSFSEEEIVKVSEYISSLNKSLDRIEIKGVDIKTMTLYSNGSHLEVQYPKSVKAEKWFVFVVKLVNNHGYKKMGGVTLSFPQYDELDGFVVSKSFQKVTEYSTPSKVYNKISKSSKKVRYVILEGWENEWEKGEGNYLKLKLKFPKRGNLKINVRAILIDKHKQETLFPKDNEELDQQGYSIEEITIHQD